MSCGTLPYRTGELDICGRSKRMRTLMKAALSAWIADTISADVLLIASRTATRASDGSTSACRQPTLSNHSAAKRVLYMC